MKSLLTAIQGIAKANGFSLYHDDDDKELSESKRMSALVVTIGNIETENGQRDFTDKFPLTLTIRTKTQFDGIEKAQIIRNSLTTQKIDGIKRISAESIDFEDSNGDKSKKIKINFAVVTAQEKLWA